MDTSNDMGAKIKELLENEDKFNELLGKISQGVKNVPEELYLYDLKQVVDAFSARLLDSTTFYETEIARINIVMVALVLKLGGSVVLNKEILKLAASNVKNLAFKETDNEVKMEIKSEGK